MVNVNTFSGEVGPNALAGYHVCVVTECYDEKLLTNLNEFCHNKGIGFISAGVLGLYANCFVDFGESHQINDKDGQAVKISLVSHIDSKEENPEITTLEAHPHDLSQGDFIKLNEVKGMTELNGAGPFKVTKVNTPFNFTIECNTKAMSKFESGGFVT